MGQYHAKLNASSAYRWMNCPGSIQLIEKHKIKEKSGAAAEEGTSAHALVEIALRGNEKEHPRLGWIGHTFRYEDHGVKKLQVADEEMNDAVQVMTSYVYEIAKEHPKAKVHLELKVSLVHVRKDMWGTADVVVDAKDTLIVIDYKHGFVPVHLTHPDTEKPNSQLMFYGAGALNHFGNRHKKVILAIVQPRSFEVPDIQTLELKAKVLQDWAENDLWEAACNTEMADAPLVPGDHCRFCPALYLCPAVAKETQSLAHADFAEVLEEDSKPTLHTPEDGVTLGKILRWAPIIDAWLKACAGQAQMNMERGRTQGLEDFKLVQKRSHRAWPDLPADKLLARLKKAGAKSLKATDLYHDPKMLSPAQLEKLGKDVKAAVAQVAEKPEGELTLARSTDAREAVNPISDFAELL